MIEVSVAERLVDRYLATGCEVSDFLHQTPEIGFEEVLSSARIVEELRAGGAVVSSPEWGLPTAFLTETGSGSRCIALFSEFDALPDVGHACGHNLIAAWSLVSYLALHDLGDELGIRVRLIGSPAEESGAGKQLIIDRGGLEGVDHAVMVHPAPHTVLLPNILAMSRFHASYGGVEAHAAAFPWHGRNAGDAATVAHVAIGLLRQQLTPDDRVHTLHQGESGAVNVITDRAVMECMVRSHEDQSLAQLKERVQNCFRAGALAAETTLELADAAPDYGAMRHDLSLAATFREAAREAGISFPEDENMLAGGSGLVKISTDMGNVSRQVPAIHPMVAIPTSAVNHQRAFADACTGIQAENWIRRTALATVLFASRLANDRPSSPSAQKRASM